MNRVIIIGNLTRDPETRTTPSGSTVCSFTVAVNHRKKKDGQNDVDFFRVSAWRELGENCAKYLSKGRKVCVVGSVSAYAFKDQNGEARASLEVSASEVEFLSSGQHQQQEPAGNEESTPAANVDQQSGMETVETSDLPF